jgi:hypothetical protein
MTKLFLWDDTDQLNPIGVQSIAIKFGKNETPKSKDFKLSADKTQITFKKSGTYNVSMDFSWEAITSAGQNYNFGIVPAVTRRNESIVVPGGVIGRSFISSFRGVGSSSGTTSFLFNFRRGDVLVLYFVSSVDLDIKLVGVDLYDPTNPSVPTKSFSVSLIITSVDDDDDCYC